MWAHSGAWYERTGIDRGWHCAAISIKSSCMSTSPLAISSRTAPPVSPGPVTPGPIDIVYIAGVGRSGSTLLELILNQLDGFVAVGELRYIWRVFKDNHRCGCGTEIRQCPFWTAVVEHVFGGFQQFDPAEILDLRLAVDRIWRNPQTAFPRLRSRRYKERAAAYGALLDRLFEAIRQVSGARYVIDSSKHPSHGALLLGRDALRTHLIHLVRDSRAVGYSWRRRYLRPEIHWKNEYMPVFSPAYMLLDWYIETTFNHLLLVRRDDVLEIRYEDFVTAPQATVARLVDHVGAAVSPAASFTAPDRVVLGTNHTVAGNPLRFRQGALTIRPDLEWQREMGCSHRALITAATWPYLRRYGYLS